MGNLKDNYKSIVDEVVKYLERLLDKNHKVKEVNVKKKQNKEISSWFINLEKKNLGNNLILKGFKRNENNNSIAFLLNIFVIIFYSHEVIYV